MKDDAEHSFKHLSLTSKQFEAFGRVCLKLSTAIDISTSTINVIFLPVYGTRGQNRNQNKTTSATFVARSFNCTRKEKSRSSYD